jgi:dodecin
VSDHIYKKIELVGSSANGIEDAVNNAISRAGKTIRNMSWFEVAELRGHLQNNKVAHWQVTVKVGFTLDNWWDSGFRLARTYKLYSSVLCRSIRAQSSRCDHGELWSGDLLRQLLKIAEIKATQFGFHHWILCRSRGDRDGKWP